MVSILFLLASYADFDMPPSKTFKEWPVALVNMLVVYIMAYIVGIWLLLEILEAVFNSENGE